MTQTQRTEFVLAPVEIVDGEPEIIDPRFYTTRVAAEWNVLLVLEDFPQARYVELATVDVDTRTYQYYARIHRDGRREDLRVMPEPKVQGPRPQQETPHPVGSALGNGVVYDDGGRRAAGFVGNTGDCVVRAVTIAAGLEYREVYDRCATENAGLRRTKRTAKSSTKRSARHGTYVNRKWFRDWMTSLGFEWVATMSIGSGCTVHLTPDELPKTGRLVVRVSRHVVAIVDGVIRDTYDCTRDGTRCVYGYWRKVAP